MATIPAPHMDSKDCRVWRDARGSLLAGAALLGVILSALAMLASQMPELQEEDAALLTSFPPRTLVMLLAQRDALLRYAAASPATTGMGLCLAYVAMQTLAIPGTLALSVLAGAMYGQWRGWVLVSGISTLGALCCYTLSLLLGKPLVSALWPRRFARFAEEVAARRGQLLSYIIFLRVTPLLPNTFINVASPLVGVPVWAFATGTLLGCMPNNFVAVGAGTRLSSMDSLADLYDRRSLYWGLGIGGLALLPIWLRSREEEPKRPVGAAHED